MHARLDAVRLDTVRPNRRTAASPTATLIDIAEAAARLGVTVRFMRRLVDERRITFHKIGKYVRFDPADVNRFAMQGRVEAERA
jgi:excisionase family DNA binding protein